MDTECLLYSSVSHTMANRSNEMFKIVAMREQMAINFYKLVGEQLFLLINQ